MNIPRSKPFGFPYYDWPYDFEVGFLPHGVVEWEPRLHGPEAETHFTDAEVNAMMDDVERGLVRETVE